MFEFSETKSSIMGLLSELYTEPISTLVTTVKKTSEVRKLSNL